MSGTTPLQRGDAARAGGESGLHLVEDQEGAFAVHEVADRGEVAVVGSG